MKILPPADEDERRHLKASFESQLRQATGGPWRVYIVPGRYGWYARAEQVRRRRKGQGARGRKTLLVSAQPGRSGGASFPAAVYLRTATCHPKAKLRG